jgi:hypothetical protein
MKKAGFVCLLGVVVALFSLGCGHPTQLTSMSVSPTSSGVIGIGDTLPSQFTAYGVFTHPAETRNITTEVTWTSSVPEVAVVSSGGVVTSAGIACGGTVITATAGNKLVGGGNTDSQSVMAATATFTVYSTAPNCPQPPQ